jgi:hypothetical protein
MHTIAWVPRISLRCTDLPPVPTARQLGLAADSDRPQVEAAKARSGPERVWPSYSPARVVQRPHQLRVPDRSRPLRAPTGPATGCQVVSEVAALPAAQPEPLGAASRYGCGRGLRPWQFSFTSKSDVNAAPSDETSRPARRVSPGHRFKDGLRPRAAALWRPLYGESADLGHCQAQPP